MLIVIGAIKGAPGASTTAIALAGCWPRPALLVEADPFGGDLLYTLRAPGGQMLLSPRHTLLQMAAVSPQAIEPGAVHAFTQIADGGLRVLLGAGDPAQSALLARIWPQLAPLLSGLAGPDGRGIDVIVDAGRWSDTPAHQALVKAASMLVTVTRPSGPAVLAQLHDRISVLRQWRATGSVMPLRMGVVVRAGMRAASGACQEMAGELARIGAPADVVGALVEEKKAAPLIGGRPGRDLLSGAANLARVLAARPAAPPVAPPAPTYSPLAATTHIPIRRPG